MKKFHLFCECIHVFVISTSTGRVWPSVAIDVRIQLSSQTDTICVTNTSFLFHKFSLKVWNQKASPKEDSPWVCAKSPQVDYPSIYPSIHPSIYLSISFKLIPAVALSCCEKLQRGILKLVRVCVQFPQWQAACLSAWLQHTHTQRVCYQSVWSKLSYLCTERYFGEFGGQVNHSIQLSIC